MNSQREVPLTGDTLAWMYNEITEIKARLANIQQAADQSRAVAADDLLDHRQLRLLRVRERSRHGCAGRDAERAGRGIVDWRTASRGEELHANLDRRRVSRRAPEVRSEPTSGDDAGHE